MNATPKNVIVLETLCLSCLCGKSGFLLTQPKMLSSRRFGLAATVKTRWGDMIYELGFPYGRPVSLQPLPLAAYLTGHCRQHLLRQPSAGQGRRHLRHLRFRFRVKC